VRVIIGNIQRKRYFTAIKKASSSSWESIADKLGTNRRMLDFWKSGQYSIPIKICQDIKSIYRISIPKSAEIKPLYWHTRDAGRKGGIISCFLHGNPGTKNSRKKGGINSIKSKKLKGTAFQFRKPISIPTPSRSLSELIGIMIGDGNITHYQIRVSLNIGTDIKYSQFVKKLFEKLFKTNVSVLKNKKSPIIDVIVSSKSLVDHLQKLGLPMGDKIRQQIDIPSWIKNNNDYKTACLRGIFDTDGSIYLDKHIYNDREYKSINIDFTSASRPLLDTIYQSLVELDFHPTLSSNKSVRLRRKKEIVEFFDAIGSSNAKHIEKFNAFTNSGGVSKWP